MDFVQLEINYADWESDIIESRKCYEVARAHGLPVVAMELVKGGLLVQLPPQVEEILRAQDPEASMASWALRFCASLPGVIAVLSGMTTMDQMQRHLHTMKAAKPLTTTESAAIDRARVTLSSIPTVPCTDCRYCMKDCPQGIHIPIIMDLLDIMASSAICIARRKTTSGMRTMRPPSALNAARANLSVLSILISSTSSSERRNSSNRRK